MARPCQPVIPRAWLRSCGIIELGRADHLGPRVRRRNVWAWLERSAASACCRAPFGVACQRTRQEYEIELRAIGEGAAKAQQG